MPRELPIGNGSLLISFDKNYLLRDVYYPHVGGANHTLGHPSRFGVWVEGQFSWVSSPEWEKSMRYQEETLVTDVRATNSALEIELVMNDAVDCLKNIYLRRIEVGNLSKRYRQIRLFINHDFHIWETRVGDTAYYDPRSLSVIHYKKAQYFLISAFHSNGAAIDQYTTGAQDFGEGEGTWRDAEDGVLNGNPIADGNVDSTIGLHLNVPGKDKSLAYYWVTVGRKYGEVIDLNTMVRENKPEHFINRTTSYWRAWLRKKQITEVAEQNGKAAEEDKVLPDNLIALYKRSLLILRTQIDNDGGIIAANDLHVEGSDSYSYVWPRDGALIACALDEAGYAELTKRFFQFCAHIITSDGFFLHKYNPDHSLGSSWIPWVGGGQLQLPIQEDETALVVWAFWHHFQKHQSIEFVRTLYEPLVTRPGDFMLRYRDENTGLPLASYDLWEERRGIHTFTTSAVYAGLLAAANFAELFGDMERADKFRAASEKMKVSMGKYLFNEEHGHFLRTIVPKESGYERDLTVDSSLYGTFAFGTYSVDDDEVSRTMQAIQEHLTIKTHVGGIARYSEDYFHRITDDIKNVPGNPWVICTLWMAQYIIAKAKTVAELREAVPLLQWVSRQASESGALPEQLHPYTGEPLSVSPLTWSHGEFVLTVQRYIEKHGILTTASP